MAVNKISDITVEDIANYLRVDDANTDEFATYIEIAKNYISSYTGIPILTDEEEVKTLDDYTEFVIVVYILCQDMYDNRTLYVDKNNTNRTVSYILDMHRVNQTW